MGKPTPSRRPERIGAIVARLLDDGPWGKQVKELQAFTRWRDIVGIQIARQAQPESFKDGVLVVRVQNSVWLSHLRFLAEELREKLNREIPSAPIEEIRFRLGSVDPVSPSI
jgi:predicted nucleic acid-binding Zn ribbon protein